VKGGFVGPCIYNYPMQKIKGEVLHKSGFPLKTKIYISQ
jgi:hypothetical protein